MHLSVWEVLADKYPRPLSRVQLSQVREARRVKPSVRSSRQRFWKQLNGISSERWECGVESGRCAGSSAPGEPAFELCEYEERTGTNGSGE